MWKKIKDFFDNITFFIKEFFDDITFFSSYLGCTLGGCLIYVVPEFLFAFLVYKFFFASCSSNNSLTDSMPEYVYVEYSKSSSIVHLDDDCADAFDYVETAKIFNGKRKYMFCHKCVTKEKRNLLHSRRELYDILKEDGYLELSLGYEEFHHKFEEPEAVYELYNLLKEDGYDVKDYDYFCGSYGVNFDK